MAFYRLAIVLVVVVQLLPFATTQGCPMGCWCDKKFVDCSALMKWPKSLPADTERFRVSQMNTKEIPKRAFSNLHNISLIEIKSSNFGQISRCAFTDIPSLKRIVFDKAVIGNVESYAFWNLHNLDQFEITKSRIGRLKSYAFYNLTKVSAFTIVETNLINFYTHGICNINDVTMFTFTKNNVSDVVTSAFMHLDNIDNMQITLNKFWNLHCGVLDSMLAIGTSTIFDENTFYCNCSIASLVNTEGKSKYSELLPKSQCHGPDGMKTKTSLSDVQFSEIGCRNLKENTVIPCRDVRLRPDPTCSVRPSPSGSGKGGGSGQSDDDDDDGNSATMMTSSIVLIITVLNLLM